MRNVKYDIERKMKRWRELNFQSDPFILDKIMSGTIGKFNTSFQRFVYDIVFTIDLHPEMIKPR